MKHIKRIVVSMLFYSTILTIVASAADFESIASAVISNIVRTQPSDSSVKKIYEVSQNRPIWVTEYGFTSIGRGLLDQVGSDPLLDRNSKIYRDYNAIKAFGTVEKSVFSSKNDIKKQIKLELKMTNLYRNYSNYKIYGMINWHIFRGRLQQIIVTDDIRADWEIYPKYNTYTLLYNIITTGDVRGSFDATTPKTQLYTNLEKIYFHYLNIAKSGQWPVIPKFEIIKPGGSSSVIPQIRKRLYLSGDLIGCEPSPSTTYYDSCLVDAVKRFQKRTGDVPDGVIGSTTQNMLRLSINQILTKMQLNLDRMKMMKRDRDNQKHIMINIPAFTFYFYDESGQVFQNMKVITGQKKHPTPVFSNDVQTVVLNPYWNVPKSIIQKEMIPKLLRNPNAMQKEGIEIRNGWDADSKKISGGSVDWSQYRNSPSVPYHFAQVPGNRNALGKIKFLFPNKFSVYMHDTPTKHLFQRNVRSYSHGCIRLEKPKELMKTFANMNENLDYEQAQKILKGTKQTFFAVNNIPVDVTYLTTWVDPDGTLQMRNDIYDYDKEQLQYKNTY